MEYDRFWSEGARKQQASEIRELLKLTQRSDIVSFAGGLPNPLTFPVDEIRETTERVLRGDSELALQYGPTEGYTPLRDEVARFLNKDGFDVTRDNILITNGSQQGLDLLGRILVDKGSRVIVGNPTYLGAISAFGAYAPEYVTIDSDDHGMRIDDLEETLERCRAEDNLPRFLYTVPTFQNPDGRVIPLDRRKRILELAHEYDFLIVEDDPYGKLRYSGEPVPTLKSLDDEGRVIYFGTFSKILVPGFRLAWTVAPEPILRKMVITKQATDLCTNSFTQFIATEMMANDIVERHLPNIIELYAGKRDIMLKAMDEHFPKEGVKWTQSEGGLFTWAELPRHVNTKAMLEDAVAQKVAYVPGEAFYINRADGSHTMRLNFSHASDEDLAAGVERLGTVIAEHIGRKETVNAS